MMALSELLLVVTALVSLFGMVVAWSVLRDLINGADVAYSELSEFKCDKSGRLKPMDTGPRTPRLTGGITPGIGMTYVPSDELVDAVR